MPDRCDRCSDRALVWWAGVKTGQDERELGFCSVHSDANADALTRDGWALVMDEREVAT